MSASVRLTPPLRIRMEGSELQQPDTYVRATPACNVFFLSRFQANSVEKKRKGVPSRALKRRLYAACQHNHSFTSCHYGEIHVSAVPIAQFFLSLALSQFSLPSHPLSHGQSAFQSYFPLFRASRRFPSFLPLSPPRYYISPVPLIMVGARAGATFCSFLALARTRQDGITSPDRYTRNGFYSSDGIQQDSALPRESNRSVCPPLTPRLPLPPSPPFPPLPLFSLPPKHAFLFSRFFFTKRRIEPQRYKGCSGCAELPFAFQYICIYFFHASVSFQIIISFSQCGRSRIASYFSFVNFSSS